MTPIINSYFNKHPISWELIHLRILHLSDRVMKQMCRLQTLTGLPKHCPNKLNQKPCTICYTAKMTYLPKVTTVDTNNLQPGELIHMNFAFCDVTSIHGLNSIHGLTSMVTVICERTMMLWVLRTASKQAPVCTISFILKNLNNEQNA